MKMTIESTNRFVEVREDDGRIPGAAQVAGEASLGKSVKCRVWEGQSESGIPVIALIPLWRSRR